LEVITSISPLHYGVFLILGVISEIIVGTVIFKRIQKYKQSQDNKNNNLNTDIGKIENTFNGILRHLDELEYFIIQSLLETTNPLLKTKMHLEIDSIRAKIQHQLGHIPRMRCNLK
jgi:hypothetical protein